MRLSRPTNRWEMEIRSADNQESNCAQLVGSPEAVYVMNLEASLSRQTLDYARAHCVKVDITRITINSAGADVRGEAGCVAEFM